MNNEESRRAEFEALGHNVRAFDQHIQSVTDEREQDFLRSLQTGFLGASAHPSASYAPKLLFNDTDASENVLSTLEAEFARCDHFDISVAFVTAGGVTVLMNTLLDLERRGILGRVLVSTYLGFNDPDALAKLCSFSNVELRAYEGALHSKGYLFSSSGMHTLVVGSSNLTQGALLANSEWNLLINTYESGAIWSELSKEFERLWGSPHTQPVSDEWLAEYRLQFTRPRTRQSFTSETITIEREDTLAVISA